MIALKVEGILLRFVLYIFFILFFYIGIFLKFLIFIILLWILWLLFLFPNFYNRCRWRSSVNTSTKYRAFRLRQSYLLKRHRGTAMTGDRLIIESVENSAQYRERTLNGLFWIRLCGSPRTSGEAVRDLGTILDSIMGPTPTFSKFFVWFRKLAAHSSASSPCIYQSCQACGNQLELDRSQFML